MHTHDTHLGPSTPLSPLDRGPDATDRPRVLVVDDDSRSREILAAYLGASHTVLEAADGKAALDLLDRRVDLVLLDVMMPDMNGYDVCREVKRRTRGDYLPVMLVTAANAQEDRNSGLAAGADDFLTKPVDRQELLLRMRLFLRLQQQERTISRQLEELERLQHLKDDLVSLVVHDARGPLQTILAGLEILGELHGEDDDALERCVRAARRIERLLSDALDVRLLEEAHLPLARARHSVHGVLAAALETTLGAAQTRCVTLAMHCGEHLRFDVDATLVQRAVENVLANAVSFSPARGTVSVEARLSEGLVEITIADQGPGIPDDLKGRMFEKFAKLDAPGPRRSHGLGLFFVRLVAEAHEGSVVVADRPGGGAVFLLRLPAGGLA